MSRAGKKRGLSSQIRKTVFLPEEDCFQKSVKSIHNGALRRSKYRVLLVDNFPPKKGFSCVYAHDLQHRAARGERRRYRARVGGSNITSTLNHPPVKRRSADASLTLTNTIAPSLIGVFSSAAAARRYTALQSELTTAETNPNQS